MTTLQETLDRIVPVDRGLEPAVRAHLDDLTKPPGSLGRLEELALRVALAQGTSTPRVGRKRICCLAGDHGVACEGVSAFPQEVTPQMVANMLAGGAAINVLSRQAGAELVVADLGVAGEVPADPRLRQCRVRAGTDNLAEGPAMSLDEARRAVGIGIELAGAAADEGVTLLGTGEMGIANTTPATALFAALLGCPVEAITGRGTGIDDARLARKIEVVRRGLAVNRERIAAGPLETLAAVGGFEIAGIAGLVLGGASRRLAVVVDGFISTAGAAVACAMSPAAADYLFFSHRSHERGHAAVLEKLGARPILDLDLRLGEGTGAALAMQVIEAAVRVYNEMATFSGAGVSRSV